MFSVIQVKKNYGLEKIQLDILLLIQDASTVQKNLKMDLQSRKNTPGSSFSSYFHICSGEEVSRAKNRQDVRSLLCSLLHLITLHTGTPTFNFLLAPLGANTQPKILPLQL